MATIKQRGYIKYRIPGTNDFGQLFPITEDQNVMMEDGMSLREKMLTIGSRNIPKKYNVKGDGVTDDWAGLQAYINDTIAAGKHELFLPALPVGKFYAISKTLTVNKPLLIVGEGDRSWVHCTNQLLTPILFLGTTNVGAYKIKVSSQALARKSEQDGAICVDNCDSFILEEVLVDVSSATGFFIRGSRNGEIRLNRIKNTLADGIHTTGGSYGINITGNRLWDTGDDGIAVVSYKKNGEIQSKDVTIFANFVYGSKARGITNIGSKSIRISHNTVDKTGSSGIMISTDGYYDTHDSYDSVVVFNNINNAGRVVPKKGNGFGIEVGGSIDTTLVKNTIDNSMERGFVITPNATNAVIDSNTSRNNTLTGYTIGAKRATVKGNTAIGNGTQGFSLEYMENSVFTSNIMIDNCASSSSPASGFDNMLATGCKKIVFDGNITEETRSTRLIERGFQFHDCSDILYGENHLVNTSGPVFTGNCTNIRRPSFSWDEVPTMTIYAEGQQVYCQPSKRMYMYATNKWVPLAQADDYVRSPGYIERAQMEGPGNAYLGWLFPAPTEIVEGFCVTLVPHITNTGAVTLSINRLPVISLKNREGLDFYAGDLKEGIPYTFRKVGANFILINGEGVKLKSRSVVSAQYQGDIAKDDMVAVSSERYYFDHSAFLASERPTVAPVFVTFSPDEKYVVNVNVSDIRVYAYNSSDNTYSLVTNAFDITPASTNFIRATFSPDMQYLVFIGTITPYIFIYKRQGTDGFSYVKIPNPDVVLAGGHYGAAFSEDGRYLAVSMATTPYLAVYRRDGDSFIKLPDPTGITINNYTRSLVFFNSQLYTVTPTAPTSTMGAIYNITDTAVTYDNTRPFELNNSLYAYTYTMSIHNNGDEIICGAGSFPFLVRYKWDSVSGKYKLQTMNKFMGANDVIGGTVFQICTNNDKLVICYNTASLPIVSMNIRNSRLTRGTPFAERAAVASTTTSSYYTGLAMTADLKRFVVAVSVAPFISAGHLDTTITATKVDSFAEARSYDTHTIGIANEAGIAGDVKSIRLIAEP